MLRTSASIVLLVALLGARCERRPIFVVPGSCPQGCTIEVETAVGWVQWSSIEEGDCITVPDWFSVRVCNHERCLAPGACDAPPQCVASYDLGA